MTRFKLYADKDAEVGWLNEMSEKGYAMTGYCAGFYYFEACIPGEYLYQVDLTPGMFRVSEDYRQFMLDAGVEIACLWGPWVVLRRRAEEGFFELYTDAESSIEQYEKIRRMYKRVIALELGIFALEVIGAAEGSLALGLVFMLMIGAIIVPMAKELARINSILTQLYEKAGRQPKGMSAHPGRVSNMLFAGLILNALALCLQDALGHTVRLLLQLGAVTLMCAGMWRTFRGKSGDGV